jgi:hypothetical protein
MSELLALRHLKVPGDAGAPPRGLVADVGGAQPEQEGKDITDFSMDTQQEQEWCWAAVTQSVERWRQRPVSQPEVASHHINAGAGLICARPLSPAGSGSLCAGCQADCADPHSLGIVLNERGHLTPGGAVNAPVSFQDIRTAVDANKPLPVRIEWGGGQGHFICVTGYAVDAAGVEWVTVYDPLLPGVDSGPADNQDLRYNDFAGAYPSTNGTTGRPNFRYKVQ